MNLVVISFYIVTALMGLGLFSILLFGVRSVYYGKVNTLSLVILCIPIVLLFAIGFIIGDWARAGILTIAIMMGLAVFSLLVTGVKSLFNL